MIFNMEYQEIQNKELKVVLHFLKILQHTRELFPNERILLNALNLSFPVIDEERSAIYRFAKDHKQIEAPESFPNARGGKDYYLIDSQHVFPYIKLTETGKKKLENLLPFAERWLSSKEMSEHVDILQKQFLQLQIDSISFSTETTKKTIKIAKSAKYAAWASAICAFFTVILSFIELLKTMKVL